MTLDGLGGGENQVMDGISILYDIKINKKLNNDAVLRE